MYQFNSLFNILRQFFLSHLAWSTGRIQSSRSGRAPRWNWRSWPLPRTRPHSAHTSRSPGSSCRACPVLKFKTVFSSFPDPKWFIKDQNPSIKISLISDQDPDPVSDLDPYQNYTWWEKKYVSYCSFSSVCRLKTSC